MLRDYMTRLRIVLLISIVLISILLLVIFRKKIEGFANRPGSKRVTFYTETQYKGIESNDIGPGKYTSADMGINKINQKIKSFKSRGNIQIRLYPRDNFGGTPSVYKSSKPSLDIDFDVKSVIILEGKNTVYTDVSPTSSMASLSTIATPPAATPPSTTSPSVLPPATLQTLQPESPQPPILSTTVSASAETKYVLLEHTVPSRNIIPASYLSQRS